MPAASSATAPAATAAAPTPTTRRRCLLCWADDRHATCPLRSNLPQLVSTLQAVTSQLMDLDLFGRAPRDLHRTLWLQLSQRKAFVECLLHRMRVKLTWQGSTITSFDGSSMIPLDEVDAPHTTGQHEHRRAASYSGRPQHQHRNMAGSAPGRRGSLFVGAGGQVLETPQSAAAAAASTAHGLFSSPDVVVAPIARRTPTGRHSVPTVPISAHAHLDLYQPHQQHIPTDPLHIAEGASAADQLEFMFQQSDVLSQAPTSYAGSVYAPTLSARNHGSTNGGSIGLPSIAERPAPEAHADILHWLDGSTHLEAFQQPATMQADDSLPIAARTRKHHPSPRKPPPGNDDTLETLLSTTTGGVANTSHAPPTKDEVDPTYANFIKSLARGTGDFKTDDLFLDEDEDDELRSEDIREEREPDEEFRDDPDVTIGPDELAELLSDSAMDPVHPRSAADDLFSDIEISRLNDQLQANFQIVMQNYAYAVDAKDDNASRQWQKQIIDLRKIASTPVSAKHGLLSLPGLEKVEKVMREMNKMCTKNTAPHATRVQSDRGAVSLPPVVRYLESQFALEFDSGLRAVPVRESGNNPVRRFTATEDKLLLMGLHQIGVRNWPTIEEYYVPSRSVKQLIAHYYKLKCKKSDEPNPFRDYEQESLKPFTDEEARQLRLGVEQYGANFSCITAHVLRHKPPSILRAQWTEMMPGSGKASKGGTAATAGAANSRKRKGGGGALLDLPLLENVSRQSNVGTAPMTMALPEMGRTRGPTPVGGMPTASVHNTGSSKRTRTTAQHQPLPHHYGHGVSSTGLSMPLPPPTASQPPAEDEIARLFSMEELFFDYS